MADKGPYGKASWNPARKVATNQDGRLMRGGKMKFGTPELCRSGAGAPGNSELRRGSGMPPVNPELCRPGVMPNTMPELDRGMARPLTFQDNTARNERMLENIYDQDNDLLTGHKQMAGMP
jgi:hypothetical protein